jgi:phosphate transport system permease protein
MAAGLVLFIITLATNMIASVVVSKSRSGAGVDL